MKTINKVTLAIDKHNKCIYLVYLDKNGKASQWRELSTVEVSDLLIDMKML